ncbi:hypothetical protein GOBAR_DD00082 [Gossypium barbadense]|nr:hypothetical protein GOBAR_DD00082 [Gossypium barbadense]
MELVNDEDVETMVALYCRTRSNQNALIQLFAELAGVEPIKDPTPLGEEDGAQEPCMVVSISSDHFDHEVDSDPDVDEVLDDNDDEGVNEDGNVNMSSVGSQIHRIVIHNNLGAHMSRIDPDATHAAEFLEYPEILSAHRMAVYSDPEELATLMPRMSQLQVNQMEAGYVFVEDVRDALVANCWMARSMNVEVYSQRNEMFRVIETIGRRPGIPLRRFQTLHYLCAHVMAACAKVSLNVEQFIDEVYTLERTLCVWENEFPVLPDLSTWEVPPTTFELVPDKGLCRNPKGRPRSSKIHNKIDIREKFDGKLYGICRLAGVYFCGARRSHCRRLQRSTFSSFVCEGVRNIDEKSYVSNTIDKLELGGVKYDGGYGPGGVKYDSGYEPKRVEY